ncbi:MAG: hypothetical protein P8H22_09900 [Glaciecola sp.]|nr:hypothetical protein [Glaciecola sp.]
MKTPENDINPMKWFWGTIIFIAFCLISISLVIVFKNNDVENAQSKSIESSSVNLHIPSTDIEKLIYEAANEAAQKTIESLPNDVDLLYEKVYSGIEMYSDFHFSLVGQYSELSQAAFGNMEDKAREIIFDGFESRTRHMLQDVEIRFAENYIKEILSSIESHPSFSSFELLTDSTQIAVDNTFSRMQSTVPIASTAAILVSTGVLNGSISAFLSSITTKIMASTATKLAVKGTSVAGGALTSAVSCAWAGPIAAICGVAGGVATWLAIDATIMGIDEYINRDDFEKELRVLVDNHKRDYLIRVKDVISKKRILIHEDSKKISIGAIPGS